MAKKLYCRTELWTGEMTEDWQRSGWEPAGIIRFACRWRIMGCRCGQNGKYKKKEEMLEAEQGTAIGLCAWRLEICNIQKTGKKMKFEVQPEGACFQEFSEAIKP